MRLSPVLIAEPEDHRRREGQQDQADVQSVVTLRHKSPRANRTPIACLPNKCSTTELSGSTHCWDRTSALDGVIVACSHYTKRANGRGRSRTCILGL